MQELLQYVITNLVDDKDSVRIEIDGENVKIFVAKSDVGKIIGKQGRTAKAIRTIVRAVGSKDGKKYVVDIVDEN